MVFNLKSKPKGLHHQRWKGELMKLYGTKEELLNSLSGEERYNVIPMPYYSEATGELLGYYKFYID